MTRLLLATLLCALGTTQASAQNVVSQGLLDLDDDERNASFTLILKESDRRCDQVIRTPMAVWIGPVSSTSITRTRIGQPGERLLAMTAPADRDNLRCLRRRNALAVARPGFRQLATLGQQVAAAIGVLHVVANAVRQR